MYSVGVFYAGDFLAIIFVTVSYYLCPKRFIEKKNEYVKFFLTFFSLFFLLFLLITNIICNSEFTHLLFKISLAPVLLISHLLYPFKEVKRNQHLNFFLFFISLYSIGLYGSIILVHSLSNM